MTNPIPPRKGMVSVEREDGSIRWTWPETLEREQGVRGRVESVLETLEGYIPQNGTELLEGHLSEDWKLPDGEIDMIERQGEIRKKLGIPPIWDKEFYSKNSKGYVDDQGRVLKKFPLIDQILNMALKGVTGKILSFQDPATPTAVFTFRDYLMRKDLETAVGEEICDMRESAYGFKGYEETHRGIRFLRENLRNFPFRQPDLEDRVESPVTEITDQRFWFARYTPRAVGKIVTTYWKEFQEAVGNSSPSELKSFYNQHPEFKGSHRLVRLFSEHVPDELIVDDQLAIDPNKLVEAAIRVNEYSAITSSDLKNASDESRTNFYASLERYVSEQSVPMSVLLGNRGDILTYYGINLSLNSELIEDVDRWSEKGVKEADLEEVLKSCNIYDCQGSSKGVALTKALKQKPRTKEAFLGRLREMASFISEGEASPKVLEQLGVPSYVAGLAFYRNSIRNSKD